MDLIDRQAAIDALRETFKRIPTTAIRAMDVIKHLPSAQPDLQPTCNQLATDCISRQAAIDSLNEVDDGASISTAITVVEEMPSAQPEPITINSDYELTQEEYEKRRKDIKDMANAPIMLLPSVQPEIIRCKDCKHSYDDIGGTFCSYGTCVDCVVETDFFCRDGERREDG